jgi:hypothetical protein
VFTLDPDWTASSSVQQVATYTYGLPYDVSWEVRDGDDVVSGPVTASSGNTGIDSVMTVAPGAHANGPIPDGSYQLVTTSTVHKGALAKSSTSSRPITIVNDPPAEQAALLKARRLIRPLTAWGTGEAFFQVASIPGSTRPAALRLRNSKGVVVKTVAARNPCATSTQTTCQPWALAVDRWGDSNNWMKPGTYTAELRMPDSYGRMMLKPLGKVEFQELRDVTMTVSAVATSAAVEVGSLVGRCSSVRRPGVHGWKGSLGLMSLSRCRNRSGYRDVVRQTFQLRLPQVRNYESTVFVAPSLYTGAPHQAELGTTSGRIPALGNAWQRGISFGGGVSWKPVGAVSLPDRRFDARRRVVQVRAAVANGAHYDIGRVLLRVAYRVWRTPQR